VYSAELDGPQVGVEKLVAARLDIGEALAEDLYPRTHSVVFTSATIAAGDSFAHFARSVGLNRLPDECWRALRLASSYDFGAADGVSWRRAARVTTSRRSRSCSNTCTSPWAAAC
jgi:ATP-dependent DNA helicase DinG